MISLRTRISVSPSNQVPTVADRMLPALRCLVLLSACATAGCASSAPTQPAFCPPSIALGLDRDGRPTQEWIDAIRDRVDASELMAIAQTAKPLSADENEWRTQIESEALVWCTTMP